MDGIRVGHAVGRSSQKLVSYRADTFSRLQKCAYPPCSSNPLDTSSRRFCLDHEHYHSLCGIFGCDRDRKPFDEEEGEEETQACEREDHQLLWRRWVKLKGQLKVGGFGRVMREKSQREKRKMRGRKVEVEEESDGEGEVGVEDDSEMVGSGSRKTVNMWSAGKMAGIQLLIHACGCPIAWEKFVSALSFSRSPLLRRADLLLPLNSTPPNPPPKSSLSSPRSISLLLPSPPTSPTTAPASSSPPSPKIPSCSIG